MINRTIFLLTIVVLSSCDVKLRTVYDHQTDFSKYKTFCWMNGCEFKFSGPGYLSDSLLHVNIQKAIIGELKSKGLTQDNNNPDLLVGLTITLKDEQAIIYHRSDDTPFKRPFDDESRVMNYLKGTLVLGMADKKESKIVWETFATRYLEQNPDFSEAAVMKGIKRLLKDYPPKK